MYINLKQFAVQSFLIAITICLSTAYSLGNSPLVEWKKGKVGNTRIILESPGAFVSNPNIPVQDAGVQVISFMQIGATNAYNVTQHYKASGLSFDLNESADAYFKRTQAKIPSLSLVGKRLFTVQNRKALRQNCKFTVDGTTVLISWMAINDDKFCWVIEAHYLNNYTSKTEAERLLASVSIAELSANDAVKAPSETWGRVRVGSTRITATAPDLFKPNPTNANLEIEGMKNISSYYCAVNDEDKNIFNISESQIISGYGFAPQGTVDRMFTVFKNNSTDCKLEKRFKTKFAGKDAITSILSMSLDGLPYTSTYIVFFDKSYVWIARATTLAKSKDQKFSRAAKFLSSIQVE